MEQELGYLKGKVEGLEKKIEDHVEWEEQYHKTFEDKLDKIDLTLQEHLTFYRFIKGILYTMVFIAAFKWGDIKDLWVHRL